MPSQTFFNLPKEKQDRIMAAAREEFFTHSFDEASINRLIKAAGIPGGAFTSILRIRKTSTFTWVARSASG